MLPTRRRRRNLGSLEFGGGFLFVGAANVAVTWGSGAWSFTPGEGAVSNLSPVLDVSPATDSVEMDLTVAGTSVMGVAVISPDLTATDPGPADVSDGQEVRVTVTKNGDPSTFSVTGSVTFAPAFGAFRTYNLLAHSI